MQDRIRIKLLGDFAVFINEICCDEMLNKTNKGLELIQLLILNDGQPVPNQRLLASLWPEDKNTNPENALKTLVSRTRATLNQILPGFGSCIVADRGAYHWQLMPGMIIDTYEVQRIFEAVTQLRDDDSSAADLLSRLLGLYTGDIMQNSGQQEWMIPKARELHQGYLNAVYAFVDILKRQQNYREVISVCRSALDIDNFDDRLHIELMAALVKLNMVNEALMQYKHAAHLNYNYLGKQPSKELQEFYMQIANAGKTIDSNIELIMNELTESGDQRGAFVCEYSVFKEIFNLQMRNLERLGSSMFLVVLMVTDINGQAMESIKQDSIMSGLLGIMKQNLRKGDTITHYSPTTFALLLPTVNYTTGSMVMERIKRIFYKNYPNSNVSFSFRLKPLSSSAIEQRRANLKA